MCVRACVCVCMCVENHATSVRIFLVSTVVSYRIINSNVLYDLGTAGI
jgi:hypothetical protein